MISFDCDLTHGYFIHDFNQYLFYDDINFVTQKIVLYYHKKYLLKS